MAYTAWSVVYGEQPTAAKWNQLGTNDAGFKDGTNFDSGIIKTAHLGSAANLQIPYTNVANDSYSTSETAVGKWIDDKTIYRVAKVGTSSLPSIALPSGNIDKLVKLEVYVFSGAWRQVPWLFNNGSGYGDAAWAGGLGVSSSGGITMQAGANLATFTKCVIIAEYTKV